MYRLRVINGLDSGVCDDLIDSTSITLESVTDFEISYQK